VVSGGGAVAVLLSTTVDIGRVGFFPDVYEPTWALPGKQVSFWFELAGAVLAAVGLALALYGRRASRAAPEPHPSAPQRIQGASS
jgi:hypothetical protein